MPTGLSVFASWLFSRPDVFVGAETSGTQELRKGRLMIPIPEYWRAVAKAINAEDEKLSLFVNHASGLGTGREAILRRFLVTHTPEPFRIETGFIGRLLAPVGSPELSDQWTSMQCDLLVYNPQIARPYYAIEDLVVVPREAAAAVVEVKTDLGERSFQHMLELWKDTHWLPVNVLGFAYDGWLFDTFIDRLKQAIRDQEFGVPDCVAVHRQNYIFIRTGYHGPPTPKRRRPARYQLAVNFGAREDTQGLASGCFLDTFLRHLPSTGGRAPLPIDVYLPAWFNQLPLPKEARLTIADDGTISHDLLPTG